MENPRFKSKTSSIDDLIKLIETLRSAKGCPWDRKQTPRSILVYLIEELYELADALEIEDLEDICAELGDVLFHVFFMARIFQELGHFSIQDVARDSTTKMIRRHPHVFGTDEVGGTEEVIQNWHKIKLSEKNKQKKQSILDSIPTQLPALMRAYKILERTTKTTFDRIEISGLFEKMAEQLTQIKSAFRAKDMNRAEREIGDILLTLVNLACLARVHPETALTRSIKRFEQHFRRLEAMRSESGQNPESLSHQERGPSREKTKKRVKRVSRKSTLEHRNDRHHRL